MAGNATRGKTGSTTKKTITGTNKSSKNPRGFGQSAVSKLFDKYGTAPERGGTNYLSTGGLRGKGGSGDAAITRQYGASATPAYTAPKATTTTARVEPTTGNDRPTYVSGNAVGTETGVNAASTSGTPGGATGVGGDILSPLTGQVGQYGIRPDAIPMLYQEPQALLRMAMANMGMSANKNPGMYNMALPQADLVNALSMIGLGNDYKAGDNSSMLNYMDNLFRQGLTKGGDTVDFQSGMSNILGANINTPMGEMLNNDDPRGQYSALSSLMLPLAEAGMHPLFARSLQKSMERLRDEYYQRHANGTPPESMAGMMNSRLGLGG
jgi:hypothetical protein